MRTVSTRRALALILGLSLTACGAQAPSPQQAETPPDYGRLERMRFNQLALRLNLPLFWSQDTNDDGQINPSEIESLLFYPQPMAWTENGTFTPAFDRAYARLVAAQNTPAPSDARIRAVWQELDATAPTLVHTELEALPDAHREFAQQMIEVAHLIDRLYTQQIGMYRLAGQAQAVDVASQSLFRRNWGPHCRGRSTENNEACSALPNRPEQPVDVYPQGMQSSEDFCQTLEERDDAETLLTPFTVVREDGESLRAVPYTEAYAEWTSVIAESLRHAAEVMTDPEETALITYLRAAAQSFTDNNWEPADEAWSRMNAQNSRWYLRVAPDEVYWDPCRHKAGFHMTFALINRASLTWQERLTPIQGDMEAALAALTPSEYEAREVSFHMPDFIDITINAGDDRDAFGATIGQSLPNWGPVANEGRGRTVAMSNLYTDPDSQRRRNAIAASLLSAETLATLSHSPDAGLMSTILHEATHNLGPAHEYRVEGRTDDQVFGGGMASMLEELKAQSGALFFVSMLRERGLLTEAQAHETYLDSIVWAFGHISRGMYTPSGRRKAYSQLAAVQVGFLMEQNAILWDANATAADGESQGAFSVNFEALPTAIHALMTRVMHIKAAGDRADAEALAARYVDGDFVPHAAISARYAGVPGTTFLYAIDF